QRAARQFDDFRDNLIVAARQAVRQIDLARFQLELNEEAVRINERRVEDLNLRDDSDPQSIVDAQNDLIEARNDRDQALTDLRNAVLNYLLDTGQLRVARDGDFNPLPGMIDEDAGAPAGGGG
ncbi:MAG: TolC family protein, partial [Planctomycetota bacterium]